MKTYKPITRSCWLAFTAAILGIAGALPARSSTYAYDQSGNPTAVTIGAAGVPAVTSPPQTALIGSNSSATFSVVASGSGLSYQWLSNGVVIIGANGDSLLLGNLPLNGTNLGNFSVIISNSFGAITSAPAVLWSDANGNGIPDSWETQYFHNLNQTALGDFDGDGVGNLNEYLEGTNPTNAASFNPRLYIQAARGSVSATPDQPYYTMGQVVSLIATPDAGEGFVGWSGAVTGNKPSISVLMTTNKSVTANFGFPLGVALDNTNLVWTTTGTALWFGQAEFSEDGANAAQSGPVVSFWDGNAFVGDQTSMQTTFFISQAEQLGFWWAVSSQPPDAVAFSINSNQVAALSGPVVSWQYFQTNLPSGVYTLRWTYSKGPVDFPDGSLFLDSAWVDQVSLASAGPVPVLGIRFTGGNTALLYWPVPTSVFRLQQTPSLNPANWTDSTNAVTTAGGTNQISITSASTNRFYRLVYP